ncbi:MAG: TetR/AcrR family transcriptional regulator [Nevskia sp.]|nr:TetR/AcrR family transcriptional regulator [Nevskia sp.]
MSVRQLRRDTALERVVDHLLEHGLGGASLRTLAAAAGTSDRMLLYYFADKDELMLAAFERIVQRLSARLSGMLPEGRQPFDVLLGQMWAMLKLPEYEPYQRVWQEALGRASQGESLYSGMANRVLDIWVAWFEERLAAAPTARRDQIAAIVAVASGLAVQRHIGRSDEADAAVKVLSAKVRRPRPKPPAMRAGAVAAGARRG